jgi:hypothetical protein
MIAVALTAAALIGLFATEIADTDFWWHLKTARYIIWRVLYWTPRILSVAFIGFVSLFAVGRV